MHATEFLQCVTQFPTASLGGASQPFTMKAALPPASLPPPPPASPSSWAFWCGTPGRGTLGCATVVVAAVVVATPIVLLLVVPSLVGMFFNAATLTVLNCTLADPSHSTLSIEVGLELNNAGPLSVSLEQFDATLVDLRGREFGWLRFPSVTLKPHGPTVLKLESQLVVLDEEALAAEGSKLLHGKRIAWDVKGQSAVVVYGIPFRVEVWKRLEFLGALLEDFEARSLQVTSANATEGTLDLSAEISFLSVSPFEFLRIGTLEVELWYNPDANDVSLPGHSAASQRVRGSWLCRPQCRERGDCKEDECPAGGELSLKIGVAFFYEFEVRRGAIGSPRTPALSARVLLDSSAAGAGVVAGRWASRQDQTVIALGPTNKWFLDRIWQGLVTVQGAPISILAGALGTRETFVLGYNVQTGETCDLYNQDEDVCQKARPRPPPAAAPSTHRSILPAPPRRARSSRRRTHSVAPSPCATSTTR